MYTMMSLVGTRKSSTIIQGEQKKKPSRMSRHLSTTCIVQEIPIFVKSSIDRCALETQKTLRFVGVKERAERR